MDSKETASLLCLTALSSAYRNGMQLSISDTPSYLFFHSCGKPCGKNSAQSPKNQSFVCRIKQITRRKSVAFC